MNRRKGIILAGGTGSRLFPATKALSKQLMPVYDKPMVYYALTTLMLTGLREILVISTPRDLPLFESLLGDGSQWGISLSYAAQPAPNGLPEAFLIGRSFLGRSPVAMILGDNLFYGQGLREVLEEASTQKKGATVFAYRVATPERYGVVAYDGDRVVDMVEKPAPPPSHWAITGLYFYDSRVVDFAREIRPSPRGELEITDLNRLYLKRDEMDVVRLGRGYAWLDTGTHESLANAAEFIRIIEQRQDMKIGCPEEIAYSLGYIGAEQVLKLATDMGPTDYAAYLRRLTEKG